MDAANFFLLDTETKQALTTAQAWHYRLVPRKVSSSLFTGYIDQACDVAATAEELEVLLGKTVKLEEASSEKIQETLQRYYLRGNQQESRKTEAGQTASEEFVVKLIAEARELKSSDIHFEIYEEQCRLRMRIDGQLIERYVLKKEEYPSLVNKVKIMANLDIAEKRLPQDGRIFYHQGAHRFDIRVSTAPTLYGEKIVMRILGNDASAIDIRQLGFSAFDLENYMEGVKRPHGMLLISGPTGSGKTTTLYATLKLLNQSSRNIVTIEDPIEYTLEGINQVQVKENIGLDFARALKTFLRQDPDVIMVGEIRDAETANIAIRASLTGHLVLSTIHTNSAWDIVSRLLDMGIPPYLLANTLNTTVAQRLLRRLCPDCKEPRPFDEQLYPKSFKPYRPVATHYLPKGCESCYHTGYQGRKAVYEVIPVDQQLGEQIRHQASSVQDILQQRGIKTLAENAFELFEKGETSMEEIYPLLFNY